MSARRLPSNARKILVASIGVASVSYVVACGAERPSTSGNLVAPPLDAAVDSRPPPTSGNLVGPPVDSGQDTGWDATSGNLVAPDAGEDAADDAADGADAASE